MIIRRALSELNGPELARISGLVFLGDSTSRGSKLPKNLEDRLLDIRLPFGFLNLPGIANRCRDTAFPDTIEFIGGKMGKS